MSNSSKHPDIPLEQFRSYLLVLATIQLDDSPRHRIDASDVVQQTLLEAHQKRAQFHGPESDLAAWLRIALANNIRDARRRLRRKKRDIAHERSLEAALKESSQQLGQFLASDAASPSTQAIHSEDLVRMASSLMKLPETQREAVMLHHLQGWKIRDIAERLDRSEAAVAGLLHRGLRGLRELMRTETRQ